MTFSASAHIVFRETMSGTLRDGASSPDQLSAGDHNGLHNFKFTLHVDTGSLQTFLSASTHTAKVVGGAVIWDGKVPDGTPVAVGGTIVMYRNVTPDGRRKVFDFQFSFQDPQGTWYSVSGEKRLSDDRGFDVGADLSTLYVTVFAQGRPVAAGQTTVHIGELLDQLVSLEVHDSTGAADAAAARAAFFTFMNLQIHQVYPSMPVLFQADEDRYLSPFEWRSLVLVTTLMLPDPLPANGPRIDDVVANLENYIRRSPRSALDTIRSALGWAGLVAPLLQGFIPEIRSVLQNVVRDPSGAPPSFIDTLQRVAVLPYYAHPKADAVVGYARPRFTPRGRTRLQTSAAPRQSHYDAVIVGAGVAGSILAARLTQRGKRVLLLEAGAYVAEEDVSTDDAAMTATLFKASALQSANAGSLLDSRNAIPVLQARCVGGGGTVNNAICFQLPEARLDAWLDVGFPIAKNDLRAAYKRIAGELGIQPVSRAMADKAPLNPGGLLLRSLGEIQVPSVDGPPPFGVSECLVNLDQCLGCGLCNTGCGSERKRNALQVHLPAALATGLCELVPNAQVTNVHLERSPGLRATALDVSVSGKAVRVSAGQIVLSAGAVASSALLLASADVKRELPGLPIGKRFTANVGCPTFIFLPETIQQRPSLQISHYYLPESSDGFVVESWYAPPGSLAAVMPGFFGDHAARMQKYPHGTVLAPLVGADPVGVISAKSAAAAEISLPLTPHDFARLVSGVATVASAVFESRPNGVEVVAGTKNGFVMRNQADVQRFRASLRSPEQLRLGTGHPQGGNAMSSNLAISVVDERFRVRGVDNLFVCDASVFPDVAGVNPQWTVMALADLCGAQL